MCVEREEERGSEREGEKETITLDEHSEVPRTELENTLTQAIVDALI